MCRAWRSATSRSEPAPRGGRRPARRLLGDERGASAVEFAFLLPLLVALTFGVFEAARLIMLNQKLQNSAYIMADLLARDRTISENDIANIFQAIETLIEPFDFATGGRVYLTSVASPAADNTPVVSWQRVGAGDFAVTSGVGAPGGPADLPAGLDLLRGETVLVSEVLFSFEPFFGLVLRPTTIRKTSYHKPRLGTLETVTP
jgi:Flp pilus assembly protein TadG